MSRDSLIKTRSVGVFVFFYDGNNEGDEFGPEVQVLDAGSLLVWRNCLRLETEKLMIKHDSSSRSQPHHSNKKNRGFTQRLTGSV